MLVKYSWDWQYIAFKNQISIFLSLYRASRYGRKRCCILGPRSAARPQDNDASRGSTSTLANAGGECRLVLPKSFRRVRNGSTSSPEFFFPSFSPFSILVIGHFICCSTSLPNLISYGIDVQCFRANVSLPRFDSKSVVLSNTFSQNTLPIISVTRLGDLLDFGQFFEAFGNN